MHFQEKRGEIYAIFLFEKMVPFRKVPSRQELYEHLKAGRLGFSPLTFRLVAEEVARANARIDAVVQAEWGAQRALFALEYKGAFTPRVLREAIAMVKAYADATDLKPLVVVPFLSEERLKELEQEGVSGVDLCGNGLVTVPHQFAVYRTGAPNRFPSSCSRMSRATRFSPQTSPPGEGLSSPAGCRSAACVGQRLPRCGPARPHRPLARLPSSGFCH
jgi:hypothetical protein